MPVELSTLFCTPQDVWDLLGTEGVDLRNDDHNRATGYTVTATADAIVGATSISVTALSSALLRGAVLTFDGAGMEAPVAATLTAAASAGATSISVVALGSQVNSGAQARDSGVDTTTAARLVVGTRKGTSKVKLYCNGRYDDSQLVLSGSVCDWATICAAKFLCERRVQGCPKSLKANYDEAIEEMRMVQAGQLAIEDVGTRGADWPSMTNLTVVPGYDGMRARVQPFISEGTPTAFGQYIDWNSAMRLNF